MARCICLTEVLSASTRPPRRLQRLQAQARPPTQLSAQASCCRALW